jgi:hypothetical protein
MRRRVAWEEGKTTESASGHPSLHGRMTLDFPSQLVHERFSDTDSSSTLGRICGLTKARETVMRKGSET